MKEHEKFGRAYASKLDARAATTTGFIKKNATIFQHYGIAPVDTRR